MTYHLPPTPFRDAVRRASRVVLLLGLGSLTLLAWAPDPAAAIRVGIRYDEVVAALGQPEKTSKDFFGMFQNLYYPNHKIILRRGIVIEVQELKASPPARTVAASPMPEAEEARTLETPRPAEGVALAPPAAGAVPAPKVVPGPVPPKAAQPAPAPVAPVPLVRPEPSPLPREPIAPPPAGHAAATPLGDLPAALAQGVRRVRAVPGGHWTLRLVLARQPETVRNLPGFFKGERPDVFVLSVPDPGGTLYHVFYGDFATRQAAARKARQLPAAFGHPALCQYQKLRSLVGASR